MKIKAFLHNDLDGAGCGLVLKNTFENGGNLKVDTEYLQVNEVDERILDYINSREIDNYKMTFIADISVSKETANKINDILYNKVSEKMNKHIQIIDHHKTALELNEFSWVKVATEHEDGKKASGTSLLFEFMQKEFYEELGLKEVHASALTKIVELIRQYDTWDWTRACGDIRANDLNLICNVYGCEQFVERHKNTTAFSPLFNNLELALIDKEQKEVAKYLEKQLPKMVTIVKGYYRLGVVPASKYKNEICSAIYGIHGIDIAVAIDFNSGSMSFRTAKNIDLTKVVAEFGGGGHSKACGASIDESVIREAILKALKVE